MQIHEIRLVLLLSLLLQIQVCTVYRLFTLLELGKNTHLNLPASGFICLHRKTSALWGNAQWVSIW